LPLFRLGGGAWISPRYWRMNFPGLRSLDAKRPDCPYAGCAGEVMVVILTRGHGPFGVLWGVS
jgi:hypothetical protein